MACKSATEACSTLVVSNSLRLLFPVLDILLRFANLLRLPGLPDNGCHVNVCMLKMRLGIANIAYGPSKEAMLCSIDLAPDRVAQFVSQFLPTVIPVRCEELRSKASNSSVQGTSSRACFFIVSLYMGIHLIVRSMVDQS